MFGVRNARRVFWVAALAGCAIQGHIHAQSQGKPIVPKTISWRTDLTAAQKLAKSVRKPVLTVFTAAWCPWCRRMQDSTFMDPRVVEKSAAFITVKVDVDTQKAVANRYNAHARKKGGMGIPNTLFLSPDGATLKHAAGYSDARTFLATMDSVLAAVSR